MVANKLHPGTPHRRPAEAAGADRHFVGVDDTVLDHDYTRGRRRRGFYGPY